MAGLASRRCWLSAAAIAAIGSALSVPIEGLMFRSTKVAAHWDTWVFVENGTFYAYYLVTEHGPGEVGLLKKKCIGGVLT